MYGGVCDTVYKPKPMEELFMFFLQILERFGKLIQIIIFEFLNPNYKKKNADKTRNLESY